MTITTSHKVFFYASAPSDLLDAGYDRIRVEKSTDRGATWNKITTVDNELRIEATRYNYWLAVASAESTDLFRAVLAASDGNPAESPQSPTQAIDTSFEAVLTIEQLKAIYLFGVNLTNDENDPYPDELYAHYIRAAISQVEIALDVKVLPTQLKERYDFYRRDYENFCFVQLVESPVISIEKLALSYPGQENALIEFQAEWIQLDKQRGSLQVYPANGVFTNAFISVGGGYLPIVLAAADYLPNLIEVEYTAGFELGKLPMAVVEVIGKKASFGPLNTAGDLIAGAGIATKSMSIDGLSQSVGTTSSATNSGYGARLLQYEKELKKQIPELRNYLKGRRLTAV